MRPLAVGVIGHVDHGKTALVRALTGIETDRLEEEKRRGISIALGFAWLEVPGGEIDLIDMPGHERFVRTMVAGAAGIRAVVLAVSAAEGIRPQTREHVEIAGLLGVEAGVVAVTQCDLADEARAAEVGADAARLLAAHGMADAPVVHTSALDGRGLPELRATLAELMQRVPAPAEQGLAYLPVDRTFAVAGFGTVVTGTLQRGRLSVGEEVELTPGGKRARIRALQVHGRQVQQAIPGGRTAVNLRGVESAEVGRGCALATPGLLHASDWLDVHLRALPGDHRPLETGREYKLLLAAGEIPARLRLLDREILHPGEAAPAQLRCAGPVAVPAREGFVLRAGSPARTVAGGRVLDPQTRRHRRNDPAVLDRLLSLAGAGPQEVVSQLLTGTGPAGVLLDEAARLSGHAPSWVISWLPELQARQVGPLLVTAAALEGLKRDIRTALAEHHHSAPASPGLMFEDVLDRLRAARPVLELAVQELLAGGELARTQGCLRLPGFRPSTLAAEGELSRRIEAAIRAGGLQPPDLKELPGGGSVAIKAIQRLLAGGVLVRARDRVQKRELLFHRDAVADAAERLATAFAARPEGFLVGEAGRVLGISRKYSVPLLEYLDGVGITRRTDDRRTLRPEGLRPTG
ncbi:selenocysteine-specific translation elongation factor [Indioceanicola profundi]|uniref:selenocysteine-specific translation elongation factor n=1 Tax=Indioceanicola profundi TaxID=2220096 RepID=UPI000E6AA201|nr:selenocysteine-specific translation elongation factor [Indioceanicola profundi]